MSESGLVSRVSPVQTAIVFIPVDYKAMVPAVEKINAAGIPVVGCALGPPK